MNNFKFYNPTKIIFGKNSISELAFAIKQYGTKILLVYGGGSIKKHGIYQTVYHLLADCDIYELSDIDPNPRIESVRRGIEICRNEKIDVILSVGGGSVLDCSKVIAAGYYCKSDPWDIVIKKTTVIKALPVIDIMTMSATGSQMNSMAVISNMELAQKRGASADDMFPRISILDPCYTYTVPAHQSAAGTADIMSHVMETYFNDVEGTYIQDGLAFVLLKCCIKYGPVVLEQPDNYEARSNLMWASTLAYNGLLAAGSNAPWSCHAMEHVLSAVYDVVHGDGLAILTPAWMRYILDDSTKMKFKEFGVRVWGLEPDLEAMEAATIAIDKLENFFAEKLHLPTKLSQIGIDSQNFERMADIAVKNNQINGWRTLKKDDVLQIYNMCK